MEDYGELRLAAATPTDADGYMMSAQDFWRGLRDLSSCNSGAVISAGLLAAQATECVLKAYLSLRGTPTKELRRIGHNLERLWGYSRQRGFPLAYQTPLWVKGLAAGHGGPDYFFRYPLGLNGIAVPSSDQLVVDIEAMIDYVYAVERGG